MMHSLRWSSVLSLSGALVCWAAYRIVGTEVDAQGFLHEPFALIPIGWLLLVAGIALGASALTMRVVQALMGEKS